MIILDLKKECKVAVIDGNLTRVKKIVENAIKEKIEINLIIDTFSEAVREVGDLFEEGELFLPELMRSAEAMKLAMEMLSPYLSKGRTFGHLGKIVIGTIEGDIHDIGKTLVASMLSAEGFEVYDLGTDVAIDTFIKKAQEVNADIICVSALLTTTMTGQKKLIEELKKRNLRNKFKVLVGGAPSSQKWVNEIGADGTAENAIGAVKLARKMLNL